MSGEVVIVPTFRREAFLALCLKRIREVEPHIPIAIFPDRGTRDDPALWEAIDLVDPILTNMHVMLVPEHDFYGNSYNVMEAFRWAYNEGFERTFYIENDVLVHRDFFTWHRAMHEEWDDIFASMAWIFNHYAPITDDVQFEPWYYAIGTCFTLEMLAEVAKHASPLYYADMPGYIAKAFPDSKLNTQYGISHYEQDGLIQRVIERVKRQVVSPCRGRCTHLGMMGYNKGWADTFFGEAKTFEERVKRLEQFAADPYWRMEYFDRKIVEFEEGRTLPPVKRRYQIKIGDWVSEFTSEASLAHLPRRINSVDVPANARIMLLS